MRDRLRFGIVGWGVIGPTHAEAIAAQPDADLVAIADTNPEAQRRAEAAHLRVYDSIESMLASEDLDVVDICTPSGMHAAYASQAMEAGCDVIVEKPLDITREALDRVLRVQADTGRILSVIFQRRFEPAARAVRAHIEEGRLGLLTMGTVEVPWWRTQEYYDSATWRGTRALDGGVLLNQAIHSIDLLLWLMGPVQSVCAFAGTLAHRMETEDTAVAVLRFSSGALGTIAVSTATYPGSPTRIMVAGDGGTAVIEDERIARFEISDGAATPEIEQLSSSRPTAADPAVLSSTGHAAQIADVIHAVRNGTAPAVDVLEGRRAVDLILAIEQSALSGREITL